MYVSTEVATAKHVYESLKAGIDILWVGARTTANPFAVQEIADAQRGRHSCFGRKNPVNPDLDLWIGALERINNSGLKRLGVIHRGFSKVTIRRFTATCRNGTFLLSCTAAFLTCPSSDPSHIGGKRELIAPALSASDGPQFRRTHCGKSLQP